MSTVSANTILDATGGNTATINGATPTAYNTMGKNRIINGAMEIDQRNAGASVSVDGGASYTLDRYLCQDNTDGSFSVQRSTTAPTGFVNSLLVTITGTDSSLTTTQFGRVVQRIEGTSISDLAWGTASAKSVTLSFWVRSSVTGTFGGSLNNNDGNRIYAFTYTISSANTWEQKTVTVAGDTTGTWLTTTGTGIELNFGLGAGPDRSVTAGSWGTSLAYSATGATNLFATSGATWYITGVQLEVGSVATEFERRLYGTELALCQRYYDKSYNANTALGTVNFQGFRAEQGWNTSSAQKAVGTNFVIEKRATPTMYIWDLGGNASKISSLSTGGSWTDNVAYTGVADTNAKYFKVLVNSSTLYGFGYHWAADAEL